MRQNVEEKRVPAGNAVWSLARLGAPLLVAAIIGLWGATVRADVAPPVSIQLSGDVEQAVPGEIYVGVFQVEFNHPGTFGEFAITGDGWELLEAEFPPEGYYVEPSSFLIPFKARPENADARIGMEMTWDLQIVRRSFSIGPEVFAKRKMIHRAVSRPGSVMPLDPSAADEADTQKGSPGIDSPLRIEGRIVYDRAGRDLNEDGDYVDENEIPPLANVGVDTIYYQIMDVDLDGEELIRDGYTDSDGHFDTGNFDWDDCDAFGCDDPDLVLRFRTDNSIVRVEHGNGGFVPFYSWSTSEIVDFTGSYKNYGDVSPILPFEHPALHIHNSIVRTHRFILDEGLALVPKVTVVWPDPDGATTGAHYHDVAEEIHISTERQWREATHSHEYGHHFLHKLSNTIPTDYCNGHCDGIKDEDPCAPGTICENPSHCDNCPENDHDAWNEGWPDWLADVATRWMESTLTNHDGSDYQVLYKRSQETVGSCCTDGTFYLNEALDVETFVGALLRDIEDSNFDFHSWNLDDHRVQRDMMCLGVDEIFNVVTTANPVTIEAFQNAFISLYPEHVAALSHTSTNVAPLYRLAPNFPADTQPMGPVISAQSITHAQGQGGVLPCMVMAWDAPQDDANGACAYSYTWGPTPDIQASDFENDVDSIACQLSAKGEVNWVGDVYFGIRAAECGSALGDTAVFGPFEMGDCNSNGIVDLCDISCNHTGDDFHGCTVDSTLCQNVVGCSGSSDCQGNLVPDECDLASGFSQDCNRNGIPDECDQMKNWAGGTGQWVDPTGWIEASIPVNGDDVCIREEGGEATVTYTSGDTTVPILACSESLNIGSVSGSRTLTLSDPSWVDGDLMLHESSSTLQVDTRLDIGGTFTWSGGNNSPTLPRLTGAGTTYVHGGLNVPAIGTVNLYDHDLVLETGSTSLVQGRIGSSLAPSLTIRPGAVLDFQGESYLINGSGASLNVEGTLTKSVFTGSSSINASMQNDGLVHVQDGTLAFLAHSTTTGDIIGDSLTTVEFGCGGHELMPTSSLTADRVSFTGGNCGARNIRGTYDVTRQTANISSSQVFFTSEANIISYGTNLILSSGVTYFDAVVGSTLLFDNITAATVYFNSGDPIVTTDLTLVGGTVQGPSPITVTGTLTWPQSASFYGPGVVNSNGTMIVGPGGGQKELYLRDLKIGGLATFDGGIAVKGGSVVNNLVGGTMDLRIDGTVLSGRYETLNNSGTIVKTLGAGTTHIAPTTTNTGLIEIQVGTLEFADLDQNSGQILLNGGNLAMYLISNPQPLSLTGGTLSGSGMITGVVNNTGGSLEPGYSAGTLTMSHNYTQTAPGQLVTELGGLAPGTEYDQLILTGSAAATFGGTLRVELINGFVPEIGDTFDVVVAPSSSGMFDTVDVVGLPADRGMRVVDNTAGIRLQVFDPNCDGIVSDLGLCPGAICPVISYTLGQDPELSFADPATCPTGGSLPGATDFIEGRVTALGFDGGNVQLGIAAPADCGNTQDAFLWNSPALALGETHFFLARPVSAADYGTATAGETRVVAFGDCP